MRSVGSRSGRDGDRLRPQAASLGGLMVLAGLAATLAPAAVAEESATLEEAQLPAARDALGAVWTGTHAYLFGGALGGSFKSEIFRYDPATGEMRTMDARLPTGRSGFGTVWTGEVAYLFGGTRAAGQQLDEVVRYDPATDTVAVMQGRLPMGLAAVSAVWTGTHAYIFGGHIPFDRQDLIMRYDPVADEVVTMGATLPTDRDTVSAVWTGTHALLIGGAGEGGTELRDVLRYDPATDTIETMQSQLSPGRWGASAVWTGKDALLFGGQAPGPTGLDEIVAYDPEQDRLTVRPVTLPTQRKLAAAVFTGEEAFVMGGSTVGQTFLRDIVRYTLPDLFQPRDLMAFAGPQPGEVSLSWTAAEGREEEPVLGYRVYRSTHAGEVTLVATLPAGQTSHVDAPPDPVATSYYRVHGFSAVAGESAPSNRACSAPWPAHLLPSLDAPCDLPPGWVEEVVVEQRVPVVPDALDEPFLATVEGRTDPADPTRYLIDVTVAGVAAPTVGIYTAGVATAPVRVVVPNLVRVDEVTVTILDRHDPSQRVCLVSVGGDCIAESPVRLDDSDWLLRRGAKSEVVVSLTSGLHGEEGGISQHVRIPHAGQVVGQGVQVT